MNAAEWVVLAVAIGGAATYVVLRAARVLRKDARCKACGTSCSCGSFVKREEQ